MAEIYDFNQRKLELLKEKTETSFMLVADLNPNDADHVQRLKETTAFLNSVESEYEAIEQRKLEEARFEAEQKSKKKMFWLQIGTAVSSVIIAVVTEIGRNWRFKRATEKEQDEPILSLTDKTVVSDGLREREPKVGGLLGLFK